MYMYLYAHAPFCIPLKYVISCEGEYCDYDINECEKVNCDNGGKCQNLIGDFRCVCKDGYFGRYCDSAGSKSHIYTM